MRNKTLETWAWVLLYGGLLVGVLGFFVLPRDAVTAGVLMAGGGAAAMAGVVMIWWRSRRTD